MAPKDDDRPKRSWKEIDQAKTLGKKPQQDSGDGGGGPAQNRYAYNKYKSQLNRLFDQGGIGALMQQGAPSPTQTVHKAERTLLEQTTPKAFAKALEAHMQQHGMPKDVEVLMACFDLADEKVLLQALEAVQQSLDAGSVKRLQALRSRLNTLLLSCDAPKIVARAKAMLAQLAAG